MKFTKYGRYLTTVPFATWLITDKIEKRQKRKEAKASAEYVDSLKKLQELKECGALTEDEFAELKEKLKPQL